MLVLSSRDSPILYWRRIDPIVAATLSVPLPTAPSVTFALMSCPSFSKSSLVDSLPVAFRVSIFPQVLSLFNVFLGCLFLNHYMCFSAQSGRSTLYSIVSGVGSTPLNKQK